MFHVNCDNVGHTRSLLVTYFTWSVLKVIHKQESMYTRPQLDGSFGDFRIAVTLIQFFFRTEFSLQMILFILQGIQPSKNPLTLQVLCKSPKFSEMGSFQKHYLKVRVVCAGQLTLKYLTQSTVPKRNRNNKKETVTLLS